MQVIYILCMRYLCIFSSDHAKSNNSNGKPYQLRAWATTTKKQQNTYSAVGELQIHRYIYVVTNHQLGNQLSNLTASNTAYFPHRDIVYKL